MRENTFNLVMNIMKNNFYMINLQWMFDGIYPIFGNKIHKHVEEINKKISVG